MTIKTERCFLSLANWVLLNNQSMTHWPTGNAFRKIVVIFAIPVGDASGTEIAHFNFNDRDCLVWWCEALTVRLLVGGGWIQAD